MSLGLNAILGDIWRKIVMDKIKLDKDTPKTYNGNMNIVKTMRKKKGWNTQKMGEYLGVSPRSVENYEQGRRPTPQHVINNLKKLRW